MLSGSQIRRKFLDYFVQHGHKEVHSSSLVPANDPTLLFTNAGMNQFKDVFLGLEKRDYSRATTSQKCVRAGGKHDDLENVGFTNRHHTFFEMLGNFSFGDYFKEDAIAFAWELITSPQWFGIPKDKLFVTIFEGSPLASGTSDGIPCDCGRYVEIWNLVFMQYDRQRRVEDSTLFGLKRLPKPSIDTGAGLERLAAVLQGKISNYDTDLFVPLIKRAAELTGDDQQPGLRPGRAVGDTRPYASADTGQVGTGAVALPAERNSAAAGSAKGAASLRVIADHSRAATFLISDGVVPSNEGRGYVLRKIIRRAITHGRLLGQTKPFLYQMVFAVRDLIQDAYPELKESADRVSKAVHGEEARFAHTLDLGLKKLEDELLAASMTEGGKAAAPHRTTPVLSGKAAFRLYDTFGLPLDFMQDAARDQGILFDQEGFDRALADQRERARASWKGTAKQTANPAYQSLPTSVFEGYRQTRSQGCEVVAIIKAGQGAQELKPGEQGEIILDHTGFYAEAGGQVGDRGWLYSDDHNTVVAEVTGCHYPIQGVRAHKLVAKQPIRVGDKVAAAVNTESREATMRNHTATHLLHAGLREVLGKHVKQAGSLVDPGHLRFDFSHFTAVEDEELQDIEDLINKEVLRNEKVQVIENVPIDVAVNEYKAMALFGEKYGDKVRVIKIGDFSTELCGGTHTGATGEIGLIKILKEGSVSSGVRRVDAITGEGSLKHFRKDHQLEHVVSAFVSPTLAQKTRKDGAPASEADSDGEKSFSPAEALKAELEKKDAEIKRLARELDQARMKSASSSTAN